MSMAKATALAVSALVALALQGCLSFVSTDVEKVSRQVEPPSAAPSPAIRVDLSVSVESNDVEGDLSDQGEHQKLVLTFERVQPDYMFLANARLPGEAGSSPSDAELTLRVHLYSQEKMWGSPYLSGYSFLLIPYGVTRKRQFTARVLDACGEEILSHEAGFDQRVVVQLHLLWVAPLNLHLLARPHPWERTLRGLLDLVQRDLLPLGGMGSCSLGEQKGEAQSLELPGSRCLCVPTVTSPRSSPAEPA
jgi:hypothetical protein